MLTEGPTFKILATHSVPEGYKVNYCYECKVGNYVF